MEGAINGWLAPNRRPPPLGLLVMPDVSPKSFVAESPASDPDSPRRIHPAIYPIESGNQTGDPPAYPRTSRQAWNNHAFE